MKWMRAISYTLSLLSGYGASFVLIDTLREGLNEWSDDMQAIITNALTVGDDPLGNRAEEARKERAVAYWQEQYQRQKERS